MPNPGFQVTSGQFNWQHGVI